MQDQNLKYNRHIQPCVKCHHLCCCYINRQMFFADNHCKCHQSTLLFPEKVLLFCCSVSGWLSKVLNIPSIFEKKFLAAISNHYIKQPMTCLHCQIFTLTEKYPVFVTSLTNLRLWSIQQFREEFVGQ